MNVNNHVYIYRDFRKESHEHLSQEHSSGCLPCHIKASEWVSEVQIVLCQNAVRFEDLRYNDLSNNYLVTVIVYAKGINRKKRRKEEKKDNCSRIHQVVNSVIQNCANNK